MALASIPKLVERRRRLIKLLQPISDDKAWPVEMEALTKQMISSQLAEIDIELSERTGRQLPAEAG